MRVLLDTNIIIHREATRVTNRDIGFLFNWLDKLHYAKCVHPLTAEELNRYAHKDTVDTMQVKLANYQLLKTQAPLHESVKKISAGVDRTDNDLGDTQLLNEVYCGRVDILISEDKKIHTKAQMLGIGASVYRIDSFLEKVLAEHPDFVDYKVLAVKKVQFGAVPLDDSFFDSFRDDYQGFDTWFHKRAGANTEAYVCYAADVLVAFLFLKVEDSEENYGDINPVFDRKRRLKIGTFKVTSNGLRLGERFLKIVFDNARQYKVDEIYVTIFDKRPEQQRLISLLEEWGFNYHGLKATASGSENVYVRDFQKNPDRQNPRRSFPYLSREARVFIVPIYPQYHTELFPDSILRNEDRTTFLDNQPHRNAISKSYISHSHDRSLQSGDVIVFYRTGGIYAGVATTIGIVEQVYDNLPDETALFAICSKRTMLNQEELRAFWNRYKTSKPFVVNFLYAYSFQKRPNLKQLQELGVIPNITDMPRGFREINWDVFTKLVKFAGI